MGKLGLSGYLAAFYKIVVKEISADQKSRKQLIKAESFSFSGEPLGFRSCEV